MSHFSDDEGRDGLRKANWRCRQPEEVILNPSSLVPVQ